MITIEGIHCSYLPIVANKATSDLIPFYCKNAVLYKKDVERIKHKYTGLYQNLESDVIEKVFKENSNALNYIYEYIKFGFLKNIPPYIIRKVSESSDTDLYRFSVIVFNPVFKSKYINYLDPKIVDKLLEMRTKDLLKYKVLPKDFDIRDFIIEYDENNEIYKYDESLLDYKPVFELDDMFLDYMMIDNPRKHIEILPIENLLKHKMYKEAYEKAVSENEMEKFLLGCIEIEIPNFLKQYIFQAIRNSSPYSVVKFFMQKKFSIPKNFFSNEKIEDIYFIGKKVKTINEIGLRKDVVRNIYNIVNTIIENTNTKISKIFINGNDYGYSATTTINIHFKNKIIFQYYKRKKDRYGDTFKYIKIPGKAKVKV